MRTELLLCCLLTATATAAETTPTVPPAPPAKAAAVAPAERIVLAVLPCEAGASELAEIARAVPELLGAGLSRSASLSLVERERLTSVLAEQSLGVSGLGDPDTAARIGALVGARLLVLPRVYTVGATLFLSAKVINTDTGQVHTALKSGTKRQPNLALLCNLVVEDIERVSASPLQARAADDDQRLTSIRSNRGKQGSGAGRIIIPQFPIIVEPAYELPNYRVHTILDVKHRHDIAPMKVGNGNVEDAHAQILLHESIVRLHDRRQLSWIPHDDQLLAC